MRRSLDRPSERVVYSRGLKDGDSKRPTFNRRLGQTPITILKLMEHPMGTSITCPECHRQDKIDSLGGRLVHCRACHHIFERPSDSVYSSLSDSTMPEQHCSLCGHDEWKQAYGNYVTCLECDNIYRHDGINQAQANTSRIERARRRTQKDP